MEHSDPEKNYHPEDEYETLDFNQEKGDSEPAPDSVPAAAGQTVSEVQKAAPQPDRPPVSQASAQHPAPRTGVYAAPPQPQYYPPAYQQPPVYPQQPLPYPYPNYNAAPQNPPVYPQPYQPQVIPQQSVQPPVYHQPVTPPRQPDAYANPYAQSSNSLPPTPQPKPATPTGTKVFIIILCALLATLTLGFIAYIAYAPKTDKEKEDKKDGWSSLFSYDEDDDVIDSDDLYFNGNDPSGGEFTELEETITLKEDNGDTQKRDDDREDTVGTPDPKADNITLEPLPADKKDAKYNAQSAFASVSDSVVTVVCYDGEVDDSDSNLASQGTGTIISADGYIVTNAHVIGNSKAYLIKILTKDGKDYQAKVIGYDTWSDLAVLKIDAKNLKAVTFGDSALIEIGQDVIAIGSPGGAQFQNTLTKGIISAVDRELSVNKYVRYIQSDAAISPGNSGGPLCNIYGQVIGISTAKTVADYYENMSFSIPSTTVEEIVGDLIHYGYVKGRARIGFSGTETKGAYSGISIPDGVMINSIDENGALAGTDLKQGDIVVELDGKPISTFQDIYDVLADHKSGDKVTIKVERLTDE